MIPIHAQRVYFQSHAKYPSLQNMASLQQKGVCSCLLVLLCLSFSFAHRVVLDHPGDDYRKLKANVIDAQDGAGCGAVYGSRNGNGHGRMSGSRVGSGSIAAENRHAPVNGMSGGSRSGTKSFPEMNNLGSPVHPILPQYMLQFKSTNEYKKRSKTSQLQGDGGEFEPAPKAKTKTIRGEGGEFELTSTAMTKKEMKMANVAMKLMPDDDMELNKQASAAMERMPDDDMELTKQANASMEPMPIDHQE